MFDAVAVCTAAAWVDKYDNKIDGRMINSTKIEQKKKQLWLIAVNGLTHF